MRPVSRVLAVSLGLVACAPTVQFPAPPVNPNASEADRAQQYDDYRLKRDGNAWSGYRYSSYHAARMLGNRGDSVRLDTTRLFARYEDTRRTHTAAQALAIGGLSAAIVGGGLIGVAVAAAAADPEHAVFLPGAQRIGVGVAGGGLAVLGLVFAFAATSKYRQLGSMYNRDLRQELGLTSRAPRRGGPQLVWGAGGLRLSW